MLTSCLLSSGKSTPVSTADPSKPCDPFQPFGGDAVDPFQSKKGPGDPFSGKDPFAPSSASSKDPKEPASGFVDFSSVSWDGWYCCRSCCSAQSLHSHSSGLSGPHVPFRERISVNAVWLYTSRYRVGARTLILKQWPRLPSWILLRKACLCITT